MVYAAAPLVVPMTLRLSELSLRAIMVLVVSKQKGITLVFKNDPLESVQVSSSFDGVESVAGYIQREIEGQLREAFRSDLPGVIHRLSQKWLSGEVETATAEANGTGFSKDAKIETRQSYTNADGEKMKRGFQTRMSNLDGGAESISMGSDRETNYSTSRRAYSSPSSISQSYQPHLVFSTPPRTPRTHKELSEQSVPESIENYDPTYGLRSEESNYREDYSGLERVVRSNSMRALGNIMNRTNEEHYEAIEEDDEQYPLDIFGSTPISRQNGSTVRSGYSFDQHTDSVIDYGLESAAGEGRSRERSRESDEKRDGSYRSGSLSDSRSNVTAKDREGTSVTTVGDNYGLGDRLRSALASFAPADGSSDYYIVPSENESFGQRMSSTPLVRNNSLPSFPKPRLNHRKTLSSSISSYGSQAPSRFPSDRVSNYSNSSSIPIPSTPSYPAKRPTAIDLLSLSPSTLNDSSFEDDLPITLNPLKNDSCNHLINLSNSNQTLSPFTRSHTYFTARSNPKIPSPTRSKSNGFVTLDPITGQRVDQSLSNPSPIKAKRKRIFRIGAAKLPEVDLNLKNGRMNSLPGTPRKNSDFGGGGGSGLNSYAPSELSDYFPSFREMRLSGKSGYPEADLEYSD